MEAAGGSTVRACMQLSAAKLTTLHVIPSMQVLTALGKRCPVDDDDESLRRAVDSARAAVGTRNVTSKADLQEALGELIAAQLPTQ